MSHSNNYGDYTSGNILKISSPSGGRYDPVCITQALDEVKYEKDSFEICFLPVKGKQDSTNKLCVPGKALMPYKLEENHLVKLGFKKVEHYYVKDGIVIIRIGFSTTNNTGLTWNDWGFCVIELTQSSEIIDEGQFYVNHNNEFKYKGSGYPSLVREEELEGIITRVNQIHTLQNYWKRNTGSDLQVGELDLSSNLF